MYKVLVGMVAVVMALVGCGTEPDLDGATYRVSHTVASVDGMRSHTGFQIDGLTVKTAYTEYYPETITEGTFEMTEDERARFDDLVRDVLAEPDDDYLCTDSPSGGLEVQFADGSTEYRSVIFCGQEETKPLSDLLSYLTTRFMPS